MPDHVAPERSTSVLRLAPKAIPAVRAAFADAASEVGRHLVRLRREGYLAEAWLGDETSIDVREHYNRHVMDSDNGPYAALVSYEAELLDVVRTLKRMEDEYRRTEGDNAELWGRA